MDTPEASQATQLPPPAPTVPMVFAVRSARKPWRLIAGFIVGALLLVGVIKYVQSIRGRELLPVAAYSANPTSLVANNYAFHATVTSLLGHNEHGDRLFLVQSVEDSASLPVLVPASITDNIQGGQRFSFTINVHDGGLLYAQQMEKY